ncbi:hypothetical protein EV645_0875 [Kribbella rubisoli]|uniref:Uncharacterized protein n=1 Tax=Kribbella rubisoli TaxID=3075929 RepID=A0A4Q7X6E4_9ACTN|nr:hypothetical protein [Kribbella rubisoli]RZU18677.1 hypothetical protein EV645_0875 [Kribbella rubisoli]
MKPTDEIDDLLTRAGARWRADQDAPPEPDLEYMLGGGRKPRRWVPALAAASVAVVAAGIIAVLPNHQGQPQSPPQSFAQGNHEPNDELLVKPGDKVQVSGRIIAVPGKTPVFCAPLASTAIGYPPGKEPAPSCPDEFAVKLNGLDLDQISGMTTIKGVRTGSATVTGLWRDGAIDVQQQSAPVTPVPTPLPKLPCAAPAGGWLSKPSNIYSAAVQSFLAANAGQVYGPTTYYPNGTSRNAPVVMVLGVAHGDPAALREAFEKVYSGNLCVVPVLMSEADSDRVRTELDKILPKRDLGAYQYGGAGPAGGRAPISLLVYTEQVKAALAPVGLDLLDVHPDVRPVS